jgi:hypothetical protein
MSPRSARSSLDRPAHLGSVAERGAATPRSPGGRRGGAGEGEAGGEAVRSSVSESTRGGGENKLVAARASARVVGCHGPPSRESGRARENVIVRSRCHAPCQVAPTARCSPCGETYLPLVGRFATKERTDVCTKRLARVRALCGDEGRAGRATRRQVGRAPARAPSGARVVADVHAPTARAVDGDGPARPGERRTRLVKRRGARCARALCFCPA